MSRYKPDDLRKKLAQLTVTQESIETLSHWILYHEKHAESSVEVWYTELLKAQDDKKLPFLYLCNDILQNSFKKKRGVFLKFFSQILSGAVPHIFKISSKDDRNRIYRILSIWEDRRVYDTEFINKIRITIQSIDKSLGSAGDRTTEGTAISMVPICEDIINAEEANAGLVFLEEGINGIEERMVEHISPGEFDEISTTISKFENAVNDTLKKNSELIEKLGKHMEKVENVITRAETNKTSAQSLRQKFDEWKNTVQIDKEEVSLQPVIATYDEETPRQMVFDPSKCPQQPNPYLNFAPIRHMME